MNSKLTKILKKLFDRAAEEENVKNRLCLIELQLAKIERKWNYVTVNFYQIKVMPTCKGRGYKHFYWIRFFIGVMDQNKSKKKIKRNSRFSHELRPLSLLVWIHASSVIA